MNEGKYGRFLKAKFYKCLIKILWETKEFVVLADKKVLFVDSIV